MSLVKIEEMTLQVYCIATGRADSPRNIRVESTYRKGRAQHGFLYNHRTICTRERGAVADRNARSGP